MNDKDRMNTKKQQIVQFIESVDSPMFVDYIYAFLKRIIEQGS